MTPTETTDPLEPEPRARAPVARSLGIFIYGLLSAVLPWLVMHLAKGTRLLVFPGLTLLFAALVFGIAAWRSASRDIREMEAGRMDEARLDVIGAGRLFATLGVIQWPALALVFMARALLGPGLDSD